MDNSKSTFVLGILVGLSFLLIFGATFLPVSNLIKALVTVVGLGVDVLAFTSRFYLYIMGPFLNRKHGVITIYNDVPFTIAPSGNAILRKEGSTIHASTFVKIPVYNSSTEMSDDERIEFTKKFSKLLATSKTPVRFCSQLYTIDRGQYMNRIKDKLSDADNEYLRVTNDKTARQQEVERAKGSLTMWHNLLDNITKVQSNSLLSFAMVSASGGTEEEAINFAMQYAEEVSSSVNAIFGVSSHLITGQEMLIMLEPDSIIPSSTIAEQIRQNTLSEVV